MQVKTTCVFCGCGCQLGLKVDHGKLTGVSLIKTEKGYHRLCVKGLCVHEFVNHPDRLQKPLIKEGDGFRTASWDEALNLVASRLGHTKNHHGRDSIGVLASGKITNEENYLLQKLARAVLGTNNIDHCARLCHAATIVGLNQAFGSGAMTNSMDDIEEADTIFVIGSNVLSQNPVYGTKIINAVKKGAKLIVADPRKTSIADKAAVFLQLKPGSDSIMLSTMMKIIIEHRLHDKEFIEKRTEGFTELVKSLRTVQPEKTKKQTGVDYDNLKQAALLYGTAKKAAIVYSMGITQHKNGVNNVKALANLALLTGNLGRPGTGVNPLRGQNNVQGACDMGALPGLLPGYAKVSDPEARKKFSVSWGRKIPENPGLTSTEMFHNPSIRSLLVVGENPVMSEPNQNRVKEFLSGLDFMVVLDIFMTETAREADVVLPVASFAEKTGTFTSTDRTVQRVRKAVEPVGSSLPDWKVISMISERLGYHMRYENTAQIMDEIASVTDIYGGIKYERLKKEGIKWPCPDEIHPGTSILHTGGFNGQLGMFHPVEPTTPSESSDMEYPFTLTTGCDQFHWNSGTMTRRCKTLTNMVNEAYVEIHPIRAFRLGIRDGELVKVRSRRGQIEVKAKLSERIRKDVVFIPYHFSEAAANILTNDILDVDSKTPEFKVCAVSLRPACEEYPLVDIEHAFLRKHLSKTKS